MIRIIISLIITILCVSSLSLLAQKASKIDSLQIVLKITREDTGKVNTLNALCQQYRQGSQFDSALISCNEAIALAAKINFKKGHITALLNKGAVLNESGNHPLAVNEFKQAIHLCNEAGLHEQEASAYNNLGNSYSTSGQYDAALEAYLEALKLYEIKGSKAGIAGCYTNIGLMYSSDDDISIALDYHHKALEVFRQLDNKRGAAGALANIALKYEQAGNLDQAIEKYNEALKIFEENGNKKSIAKIYSCLGSVYEKKNMDSIALIHYKNAVEIYQETKAKFDESSVHLSIAAFFFRKNEYDKTEKYLASALKIADETNNKVLLRSCYRKLSELDSALGKHDKALIHYKLHVLYKDSMATAESKQKVALLKIQFETEKKDNEIQLLSRDKEIRALEFMKQQAVLEREQLQSKQKTQQVELLVNEKDIQQLELDKTTTQIQKQKTELEKKNKENELLTTEAQLQASVASRHRLVRNSLIGASVLIIVIGFLLFNRYRFSQKQKHLAERMRISSDLHDEISSTLSSISMYSAFAKDKPESAANILEEISSSSQEMIDDMNDIIWTINPRNDSFVKIIERLRNYSSLMTQSKNIALHFKSDDDLNDIALSMEHRKNLFLICKEAINNAVKYSCCKNLYVKFEKNKKNLVAEVSDDGNGFDTHVSYEGNGLKNMSKRGKDLNAILSVNSNKKSGTKIHLEIKMS